MDEIRRELGDREASADTQASRVNALLHGLTADASTSVALPARVLQGIQARSPLGDPLPLPPLPARGRGRAWRRGGNEGVPVYSFKPQRADPTIKITSAACSTALSELAQRLLSGV